MIGYYVHHLGRGHLEMARCIAARLTGDVTGLSSLGRPADWPGDWLMLPRDDTGEPAIEPTAHGQLHWAPLGTRGCATGWPRSPDGSSGPRPRSSWSMSPLRWPHSPA